MAGRAAAVTRLGEAIGKEIGRGEVIRLGEMVTVALARKKNTKEDFIRYSCVDETSRRDDAYLEILEEIFCFVLLTLKNK